MKQTLSYTIGLVIGLVILVVTQLPPRQAQFIACDVGQGDGLILRKGSNQVVIDGGPSTDKMLKCLNRHMPFWDRTIELIILTNTDFDHMNGLTAILERYRVIRFVTADGVHGSDAFDRLLKDLQETKTQVLGVHQGEKIRIGKSDSIELTVLWPPDIEQQYMAVYSTQISDSDREQILGASAKRGNLNERSVVVEWTEPHYKVLLTGDSGDQAEKELVALGVLDDVDVLKVGHHGSKYASTDAFLSVIKPEIAVISVGAHNTYGHPTSDTLSRLEKIGAKIERTDQMGEIVVNIP